MSRKWLRQCQILVLICTMGMGTAGFGQEAADGTAQPPETPATETPAAQPPAAETPAAEAPAAEAPAAQPPAATETPAATDEPAPAQETPAKEGEAPAATQDAPKEDKPESEAAAAAPADAAADQAAFATQLEQWKTILKGLRALTTRYSLAPPEEADGIKKEWDDLIAQGEQLIPQLRATGMTAYAAGRGSDRAIERFLAKLLADDLEHDRYESAYELGTSLISSGCESNEVFDAAGVAAFCTNDFDSAETFLKRAQEAGGLSAKGAENLALVDQYKSFWAEEKSLREKEAAADDLPRVKITTTRGDVIVELLENEAPDTVGNFVNLIESKKFYDGLSFHRVLEGFMAQGGCPQGDGSGGPGYTIKCETDAENHRNHFRGSLSMAHAGKDTGGSQFFLTFVPTAHLNGLHTVFGRVIEGMDVLARLTRIDPTGSGSGAKPDSIVKMEVLRKRNHEYKPNKS